VVQSRFIRTMQQEAMKLDHALTVVREGLGKVEADLATHQKMQKAVDAVEGEIARLQAIVERATGIAAGAADGTAANPSQPQT